MAAGAAAALLDELMGRGRNLGASEHRNETKWTDPEVCKYFLCSFCPHELFVNTRADLGPCEKIHDEILRKEYQKSSRFERMGYEEEFMRFLQNLISDVEKRIRRGHQRLALNSTQGTLNGNLSGEKEDKIQMLTEKINELVNQAEELGCEGKVEEAQGVMKLCDQLREERRQLENSTDMEVPQLKEMEVCEICSAFLIVGDMPQRHDEHLLGKQHAGYAQVRAQLEKLKKKSQTETDEKDAREAKLMKEREEREKEREKEREDRRKKDKDKEDERRKEREKEREKERGKDKRRHRSRSRSRKRSKSRDRRSRSRDRKRSSSRDRKSRRSRSRSRHRKRSKSRDRHKTNRRRSSSRTRDRGRRSRSRGRRSRSRDKRSRSRDKRSRSRDRKRRSRSRDKNRRSGEKGKRSEEKETGRSGSQDTEKGEKRRTDETMDNDKAGSDAVMDKENNSEAGMDEGRPTAVEESVKAEGDSNIAD